LASRLTAIPPPKRVAPRPASSVLLDLGVAGRDVEVAVLVGERTDLGGAREAQGSAGAAAGTAAPAAQEAGQAAALRLAGPLAAMALARGGPRRPALAAERPAEVVDDREARRLRRFLRQLGSGLGELSAGDPGAAHQALEHGVGGAGVRDGETELCHVA